MRLNAIDSWRAEVLETVELLAEDYFGWSLEHLADQAGVSRSTAYRLLRHGGKVVDCRSSTLKKLCRAVGLDMTLVGSTSETQDAMEELTKPRKRRRAAA